MSTRIRRSLVVNDATVVSEEAWNAELDAKHNQVVEWLRAEGLDGLLLRRNEHRLDYRRGGGTTRAYSK